MRWLHPLRSGLLLAFVLLVAACQAIQSVDDRQPLPTLRATAMAQMTATQVVISRTLPPTSTPAQSSTPTDTATPGPSPTSSATPTATRIATNTSAPTASPTSLPQLVPTLGITVALLPGAGTPTPPTRIPTPVATFEVPLNTTNVLLLGSDTPLDTGDTRTDTMIIVAINRTGPTASIISLPRDLFVYIPGRTMDRLNTAITRGGVDLLKQTILYNFGVPIHYYARVDFEGFKRIVDAVNGVEINVSCRFQDWRLKSPELDPLKEDNWEQFALEPGVHQMDGDLALWYARSRLSSNDFDRGRRQQQLLRAMFNQGVDLGLVPQAPALWQALQEYVETDMDIGRMLQIATLAPAIRENGVQHLYLTSKTVPWAVPTTGAQVHLPIWEGENMMRETFSRLFLPPALNKASGPPIFVEIVNTTDNPDLAVLAADNLAWYGFVPVEGNDQPHSSDETQLRYYGPNLKGAYAWLIPWIFGLRQDDIELFADDDTFPYNYQVILGQDYDPCLNPFSAPRLFLDDS